MPRSGDPRLELRLANSFISPIGEKFACVTKGHLIIVDVKKPLKSKMINLWKAFVSPCTGIFNLDSRNMWYSCVVRDGTIFNIVQFEYDEQDDVLPCLCVLENHVYQATD